MARTRRLFLILVVLKLAAASKIDSTGLTHRHFLTIVITDVNLAIQGPTYRPFVRQPLLRIQLHEAIAFGTGVVFVNHRPPPFDHRLFDRNRAWRSRMNGHFEAGYVIAQADLIG